MKIKKLFRQLALIAVLSLVLADRVTAQTLRTLHSFTATDANTDINSDGAYPRGGLILSGNTLYGTVLSGGSSGRGTVFAVNTDGTSFTNLHSFTGSDGANLVPLILSGNTLYGTATGTVFKVNTDGTGFTTLYSFTATSDGANPNGLILSENTLYGTANLGGSAGNGTVFTVNTEGTGFTNLHSFTAIVNNTNSDGANPETGLILSGNTLYGTARFGGSSGNGTVFAVNTDGTSFKTLHSFSALEPPTGSNGDGANPRAGLILSGNTLYGTASSGGSSLGGTVFAVNTDGTGFTNLHSFTYGEGVTPLFAGLILSDSTLYGTACFGGSSGVGTVFAINTDGTGFTNLHSFTGSDGANPQAGLILSDNTLYGTAFDGGSSGRGTIFSRSLSVTDGTNSAPQLPKANADPLDHWQWRNPLPNGHVMRSVAYGNGTFVTVGDLQTIMTSADGSTWTNQLARIPFGPRDLNAVAFANGLFFAFSDFSYFLTSSNGVEWAAHADEFGVRGIAFGNGIFVKVGDTVAISLDGFTWTNSTQTVFGANAVVFGRGLFVMVGEAIFTSTNAVDWTQRSMGGSNTYRDLNAVALGPDGFVAVGHDYATNGVVLFSPDGIDWTVRSLGTSAKLLAVTFGNGLYAAVGENGAILTSTDMTSWTASDSRTTNDLNGVTYGNNLFMAVGGDHEGINGVFSTVLTSPDGMHWTDHGRFVTRTDQSEKGLHLEGVTYGSGMFVAVGPAGGLLTSTGGVTWNSLNSGTSENLNSATFAKGTFVVVGDNGTILMSRDAATWALQHWSADSLFGVTYGGGTFVAVGDSDSILTSSDGAHWTAQDVGRRSDALLGITFGDGVFVAVGWDPLLGENAILCSTDATNWFIPFFPFRFRNESRDNIPTDVAYGNGRFVIAIDSIDFDGTSYPGILVSTNGSDWTEINLTGRGLFGGLFGVTYGNGTFVAVGSGFPCFGDCETMVLSSTDGTNWTFRWTGTGNRNLSGVTYGRSTFVLVGGYGTILQSDQFGPLLELLTSSNPLTFDLIGEPGLGYQIEASSDFTQWTVLTNFVSATGTNQFIDSTAPHFTQRYYRAVTP